MNYNNFNIIIKENLEKLDICLNICIISNNNWKLNKNSYKMKRKMILAIFMMVFFVTGCNYTSSNYNNSSVAKKAFVLDALDADAITNVDSIVYYNIEYMWLTGQKERKIEVSEPGEYLVDVKLETEKFSPYCRIITVVNAKRVFIITADTLNCVGNTITLDAESSVDYHTSVEYSDYTWSTGQKGRTIEVFEPGEYRFDEIKKVATNGHYGSSSSTTTTKGVFTVR